VAVFLVMTKGKSWAIAAFPSVQAKSLESQEPKSGTSANFVSLAQQFYERNRCRSKIVIDRLRSFRTRVQ
jgi:hypothetical protein